MTNTPAIRLMKSFSSLTRLKRLTRALATSFLATVFRPLSILPGVTAGAAGPEGPVGTPIRMGSASGAESMVVLDGVAVGSSVESAEGGKMASDTNGAGSVLGEGDAHHVSPNSPSSFFGFLNGTIRSCLKKEEQQDGFQTRMAFVSGVPVIQRRAVSTCASSAGCGGTPANNNVAFLPKSSLQSSTANNTNGPSWNAARSMSSHSLGASSSSSNNNLENENRDEQFQSSTSSKYQQTKRFSSTQSSQSKLSSSRSQNAIALLPSYLIDARAITKYHPITAPEGALQLSVAENQLSELEILDVNNNNDKVIGVVEGGQPAKDVETKTDGSGMKLVDVLSQLASSTTPRPTSPQQQSALDGVSAVDTFEKDMIYYQPTQGVPGLRATMAEYLQNLLVAPSTSSSAGRTQPQMHPDGIILGAGCNAVLENLCMCLAEPGEAVMIPTPYYAAFEFDLVARAGCHIVPVNTFQHHSETPSQSLDTTPETPIPPTSYYPNRSSLDQAYQRALTETSRAPRVLLLSHPNNPLGICYPPEVVQECIDWCRENEVHLISDEIYAGSVYRSERGEGADGEGSTFVSAMALGSNHIPPIDEPASSYSPSEAGLGLGPYVHLVYALSKDFALSGLRVGVAYTENSEILLPMQKLNDLCQISSQTQLLVERMLSAKVVTTSSDSDDAGKKFVDVYLQSNQSNIRSRCDQLQQCLDEVGIPYLPADSGLFVWMDFREFLPALDANNDVNTEGVESLESKERRERQLYLSLMKEYGLLFTPGMSMRNERAGFFRCVFTAASEEEFQLGLKRIRAFVDSQRS